MGTGAANWLIGKVLNILSDDLVAAYMASEKLGLNSEEISQNLVSNKALLHEAQRRDVSSNPYLEELVHMLKEKAQEAEDTLDELHYFIIRDQLDGTRYAVPDLGDGFCGLVRHGGHAVRHTVGNCLSYFSCSCVRGDDNDGAAATNSPHNSTDPRRGGNSVPIDKLPFDRVAMSKKIKAVIEDLNKSCERVSESLRNSPSDGNTALDTLNRPSVGPMVEYKFYGRSAIFEHTMKDVISSTYHGKTLSVLPIVGPGGIGKTTFVQHLYNDERTKEHFIVRVWVSISTHFVVLEITQQIHNCIPPTDNEESNTANATTNLNQLQESVARRLKSRRFLIVLDDMWKCDGTMWDNLIAPFRNGEAKGSMVLITTRLPKIEERVKKYSIPINLQGLESREFYKFFQACVFGEDKPDQQYNELIPTGKDIAKKLKCSPLAAKTVARLLKKDLSLKHWRGVLNNNEWVNEAEERDDIMSVLKVSYYYLPFHLKQCFSYLSLFPEGYRFNISETARFWTAMGIIGSSHENKEYLEELVANGILVVDVNNSEDRCYVMHDLFHELSRNVSTQECLNICSLRFSARAIPQSIKHLSITIENRYDENFKEEMAILKGQIKVGTLRTLMIFRDYEERTANILKDTFEEIEGLRVLFIVMNSLEALPRNFSKLLHLRYLKIRSPIYVGNISLPSSLPIFHHLISLDVQDWKGSCNVPRHISRLVNLHHFIAANELHSNVPEVGKIKHLEELKEFHVRKECVGFELEELGKLRDLGGELSIYNLEKVTSKEEAAKGKLALKKNLKTLALEWGRGPRVAADPNVVDGLKPHDNLGELAITGHGGGDPPSWLCCGIPIRYLESLTLMDVSWRTLPPFGQLQYLKRLELRKIARVHLIGPDPGTGRNQSFKHLKEVVLSDMPLLVRWVVEPNCYLFPVLETIRSTDCPNLLSLPFLPDRSVSCRQDIHCPSLRILQITQCPKLFVSLMPPAPALRCIELKDTHRDVLLRDGHNALVFSGYSDAIAFHNMGNIVSLTCSNGSLASSTDFQKATSLRHLNISRDSSIKSVAFISNLTSLTSLSLHNCEILAADGFNPIITAVSLKELGVVNDENYPRSIAVDLLSEVARRTRQLPAGSFQLEKLGVAPLPAVLGAPVCSHLASTLHEFNFFFDPRAESLTEEEEEALQLLTSLQTLEFEECPGLPSLPQGLHTFSSLRELRVLSCPEIRSLPMEGLPTSLQHLNVSCCGTELTEQVQQLQETNPALYVICQ